MIITHLLTSFFPIFIILCLNDIIWYFITWNWEPSRNHIFIYFYIFHIILFLLISYITKNICKYTKNTLTKKEYFISKNIQYLIIFYLFIPFGFFTIPIILWLYHHKIKKFIKYIILWISLYIIFYYLNLKYNNVFSKNYISIITTIPYFILWFLFWKPKKNILHITRYTSIILLFIVLFTQPFYKKIFFNYENYSQQNICYQREVSDWPCFKIFTWYDIRKIFQ